MSRRLSVTLDPSDEEIITAFATASTAEHSVLLDWAAAHGMIDAEAMSDAALMRALLRAGAEALRDRLLDTGYAQLAKSMTSGEHSEVHEARRRYAARAERRREA